MQATLQNSSLNRQGIAIQVLYCLKFVQTIIECWQYYMYIEMVTQPNFHRTQTSLSDKYHSMLLMQVYLHLRESSKHTL